MKLTYKKHQTGFTLAETLVVTLLIGIFAAMGTPNWFGYLAKQRLNESNEQLYQVLMAAQQRAMKESSPYTIALQQSGSVPQYKVYPKQSNINTIPASPAWQNLAKDTDGFQFILNDGNKLIFDYQGKIDADSPIQTNEKMLLTFQNTPQLGKKCVVVKTVFGYLYTLSDQQCE